MTGTGFNPAPGLPNSGPFDIDYPLVPADYASFVAGGDASAYAHVRQYRNRHAALVSSQATLRRSRGGRFSDLLLLGD
ncbi:MAG: hypothetical protein Kow0074_07880 [Candidatus Zixiibacteriota bacterium]